MEDATGQNLDGFFGQWVHRAGHPELEVELGSADGLATVAVRQTQSGEDTPAAFCFGLPVEIVAGGEVLRLTLPVCERERVWAVPAPGDVEIIRVDPAFSVLCAMKISGPVPWLVELVKDEAPVLAARAAVALDAKGTRAATEALFDALSNHPWHGVRSTVAALLGGRGGAAARAELMVRLKEEPDPRVVESVADALGHFRGDQAASALREAIGTDPNAHVLGALLRALGRTREDGGCELIEAHMDTPSWADLVTRRALAGLALSRSPRATEIAVRYTQTRHEDRVRAAACLALGVIGDLMPSQRRACRERLEQVLIGPGFRCHLSSLASLAKIGDPLSGPVLRRIHASAPDGRIRRAAYEAKVAIDRGRTAEEGLSGVRERLAKLEADNAELRERLGKLEVR